MASSRLRSLPRHLLKGRKAESRARRFLEHKGLRFVEANYRCRAGEIDLIMIDDAVLVFVEVRYRANQDFGGALESIDSGKRRKLRTAAAHYLQRRRAGAEPPCRFDVVLMAGAAGDDFSDDSAIDWIRNAL